MPQLRAHHDADELCDLGAQFPLALQDCQADVAVRRAPEEEGGGKDAVLHERVRRPGLEVGAELASVTGGVAVLLEVFDSDGRAEEEEEVEGRSAPP